MQLKEKIVVTNLFILAMPIWFKLMELNDKRIIKRLEKVNPSLAKKSTWFFFKEKSALSYYLVFIIITVVVLAIWLDIGVVVINRDNQFS